MIPNDLEERRKMISYMLSGIATSNRDTLSEWELNFIDSIEEQFSNRKNLSDRQCEILERIYDKI